MDIKAFKLKSGEEFIAELVEVKQPGKKQPKVYKINNPIGPTPEGLGPWFPFAACREFELHETDLIFPPMEPHAELLDLFTQKFGTIIAPPTQKVIVK